MYPLPPYGRGDGGVPGSADPSRDLSLCLTRQQLLRAVFTIYERQPSSFDFKPLRTDFETTRSRPRRKTPHKIF